MGMLPRFIVAGVDEIQTECKAPEKEFAERQTKRKRPARLYLMIPRAVSTGLACVLKRLSILMIL